MTRKENNKTKGSEQTPVGGGGAATSAGILFQQQVGAVIGSWLLTERPFDQRLNIGQAKPVWMRFETEAPVDDILVGTSTGGFVAFQVKTNAALSETLDSPFGKAISQFVRHWLACRDGDGSLNWNRPLDAQVDRLVLAVGPHASSKVREVLPKALRLKSQPGGGQLNADQQRAFDFFDACVQAVWAKTTTKFYSPDVAQELAALVDVLTFGPESSARESATEILLDVAAEPSDAPGILTGIEAVCGELMKERGGVDRPSLRQRILGRGMKLQLTPDFRSDIDRLKGHSEKTARVLRRFEEIEVADGNTITIERDCQDAIRDAAIGDSLLIIGEPGAGKSGVLSALTRDLKAKGKDVLEIAVDEHSVETLEGLGKALKLEHGLIETLEAWDGSDQAWLVVDGLDASRGGPGGGVFRTLIEQVMTNGGRWKVIASIRIFDLRMGQKFQGLFKGQPPIEKLMEQEFSNVRHVKVPPWTQTEFTQLLDKVPRLAAVMTNAPQTLRDIAAVPFNTRLMSDLVKDGLVTADFSHVSSQAELLQLYWVRRIETHGASAQACIQQIVKHMVETRVLSAPFETAAMRNAAVLDVLESVGVLISDNNRRGIQFRHHLLFDFAAARVILDPAKMIAGRQKFSKSEARGLMLAPALMFVLREIWMDKGRAEFWIAAMHVLSDNEGDPVIRSAAGRICAELPERYDDIVFLAERIVAGDKEAAQAFIHISGALGIRLEDCPEMPLDSWAGLVRDIATKANVDPVLGALRFLLIQLIERVDEQSVRCDLGIAARALLAHAFSLESSGGLVLSAIGLVCETFASDPLQSRTLLERIFAPDRLGLHAAQEVPALCMKIDKIAIVDPEFGARIYRETYGYEINDEQVTNLGNSQILSFISNTRQDYGMARYMLKEYFGTYLELRPHHAVEAVVNVVEDFIDRNHTQDSNTLDTEFYVDGRSVRLREDRSYIWAHDPDSNYGNDASTLIKKLLEHLRSADEASVIRVAKRLVETSSHSIFWSRLFLAASEREDGLLDFCLPIAMQKEFLVLPGTTRNAVDVVAKGYESLSPSKRAAFEVDISRFDFSHLRQPENIYADLERRLFGEIGEKNLVTGHARAVAKECSKVEDSSNGRDLTFRMTTCSQDSYNRIESIESTTNQKLMAAIDRTEGMLEFRADAHDGSAVTIDVSLQAMETLITEIDRETQDPSLIIRAEVQISKCIDHLVDEKQVPSSDDDAAIARFLDLFCVLVNSESPKLYDHTEAIFEKLPTWESPALRVDTAKRVLELALQRPDLYSDLEQFIDQLLQDPHPAVRLEATRYLIRIWNIDRSGFWQRISSRLADEPNSGVIDLVCAGILGRVLPEEVDRTEQLILDLLDRFELEPDRQACVRTSLADLIAILWVTYEQYASHAVLERWITDAAAHVSELSKILFTLRAYFVVGLNDPTEPKDAGLRHRSQAIATEIVAAVNPRLESYLEIMEPSAEQVKVGSNCVLLLDMVCLQLHEAAKSVCNGGNPEAATGGDELEVFFEEVVGTLMAIGDTATPRTVYYLLQLCEFLLPVNPARTFDVATHAVRSGGHLNGYQFELMGADLLVKLVGLFLADHNELFEEEDRRNVLIECLETFMDAGWPAAHRLLYRLPELIQ